MGSRKKSSMSRAAVSDVPVAFQSLPSCADTVIRSFVAKASLVGSAQPDSVHFAANCCVGFPLGMGLDRGSQVATGGLCTRPTLARYAAWLAHSASAKGLNFAECDPSRRLQSSSWPQPVRHRAPTALGVAVVHPGAGLPPELGLHREPAGHRELAVREPAVRRVPAGHRLRFLPRHSSSRRRSAVETITWLPWTT